MAILKQRLNRKNSSGTYDTIYLETCATVVNMSETDTTKLSDKLSSMDTAIAGKQPAGNYQPAGSYAAASHNHSAANITSGILAVARGGTGQTSVDTTPTSGSKKMCTSGGIYTAINNLKTSVSEGKSLIASAITDKGVSTASSATFQTMANNIGKIQTAAGSIYNLADYDGALFNNDTNTLYFPCLDINSSGGITVKNAGDSIRSWSTTLFYFGIKGAGYTKVWAYENNSYSSGNSFAIIIYEYDPFDLSTLVRKKYLVGSFSYKSAAQDLGFTMSANKVYLISVDDSGVDKQYIKFTK